LLIGSVAKTPQPWISDRRFSIIRRSEYRDSHP
jgi:hypothetical protein